MSDWFRLLLTGSRNADATTLWIGEPSAEPRTLGELLDRMIPVATTSGFAGLLLVHGGCPTGIDAIGDRWARYRRREDINADRPPRVRVEVHPADWAHGGRGAGFARNAEMIRRGADTCFALIAPCTKRGCAEPQPHGSHGATHCADLAERGGIHVQRFEPYDSAALTAPTPTPESEDHHA